MMPHEAFIDTETPFDSRTERSIAFSDSSIAIFLSCVWIRDLRFSMSFAGSTVSSAETGRNPNVKILTRRNIFFIVERREFRPHYIACRREIKSHSERRTWRNEKVLKSISEYHLYFFRNSLESRRSFYSRRTSAHGGRKVRTSSERRRANSSGEEIYLKLFVRKVSQRRYYWEHTMFSEKVKSPPEADLTKVRW